MRLGGATAGELETRSGYDAVGRPNLLETKTVGGNTWYTFGSANYNFGDDLTSYVAGERKPGAFQSWNHSATYASNGTGRLVTAGKQRQPRCDFHLHLQRLRQPRHGSE